MSKSETLISRLNELCHDVIATASQTIGENGGVASDERGPLIPQPKTEQDRIMFAAGQLQLASFIMGATLQ